MQEKYIDNFLYNALTNKYLFATIKGIRYTKKQFDAEYPDDDACLEAVFQNRFGDLKFCPKCAAETKFYRVKKRQCYACQWCGYQLHPLADTIFRKSTTSLKDWFYAIYLFSVAKNGVSAKELERHLGCTYKTAWRIAKQIRLLMLQDTEKLTGLVEVDETYIGGKRRGSKRGRGVEHNISVVGMVERQGGVRAEVTVNTKIPTVYPLIKQNIDFQATILTDEYRVYKGLKKNLGYSHSSVKHKIGEYVSPANRGVHTNTIEGFWGQMKRSIDGTYHCVSPKYLQTYVNEFVFRYNFRGVAVCPVLLELASKPV